MKQQLNRRPTYITMWFGTFSQHSISIFFLPLLVTPDSTCLLPSTLSLALPPNLILFSYYPIIFFIKPVSPTYIHTVYRNIPQNFPLGPMTSLNTNCCFVNGMRSTIYLYFKVFCYSYEGLTNIVPMSMFYQSRHDFVW